MNLKSLASPTWQVTVKDWQETYKWLTRLKETNKGLTRDWHDTDIRFIKVHQCSSVLVSHFSGSFSLLSDKWLTRTNELWWTLINLMSVSCQSLVSLFLVSTSLLSVSCQTLVSLLSVTCKSLVSPCQSLVRFFQSLFSSFKVSYQSLVSPLWVLTIFDIWKLLC